jgi:hypothetical protein
MFSARACPDVTRFYADLSQARVKGDSIHPIKVSETTAV